MPVEITGTCVILHSTDVDILDHENNGYVPPHEGECV